MVMGEGGGAPKLSFRQNSGDERRQRVGYPGKIYFFSTLPARQKCKLERQDHVFLCRPLGQHSVELS